MYDASADRYVEFVGTELGATETLVDRALLNVFVELVGTGSGTRVADLGCGPGRVAAFLARQGLDVIGVDVSPAMVDAAWFAHPEIEFEEGRLDDLPVAEGSLAGVVCWYSIIYTPPSHLGDVLTEIERVLSPTGYLLLAFQAGNGEAVHNDDAYGTGVALTSYRHGLTDVAARPAPSWTRRARSALREAEFDHETTPQAFVIACHA